MEICPICLENISHGTDGAISCLNNHVFHFQCFHCLYVRNNFCSCPICRDKFSMEMIIEYTVKKHSSNIQNTLELNNPMISRTTMHSVNERILKMKLFEYIANVCLCHCLCLMLMCFSIDIFSDTKLIIFKHISLLEHVFIMSERIIDFFLLRNILAYEDYLHTQQIYAIKLILRILFCVCFTILCVLSIDY
jgi:hypothetical protein